MEVVTYVKCPFCGNPVMPLDRTQDRRIPVYGCVNPCCEKSEDLVGSMEMWYHLVVLSDELHKKVDFMRQLRNKMLKAIEPYEDKK